MALLTLNRPGRLNAIGRDVLGPLAAAVAAAAADERVRALVIAGAGRAFCAGADLGEIEACPDARAFRAFIATMTEVYQLISDCPKPSVAALHGVAFGGGLELALACDLRVAEAGARLGVPEMKLGVLPGAGGTQRLPRLIPAAIAKQMILTGEPITAERAHALGLVNELAAPGEAVPAALGLATRVAAAPRWPWPRASAWSTGAWAWTWPRRSATRASRSPCCSAPRTGPRDSRRSASEGRPPSPGTDVEMHEPGPFGMKILSRTSACSRDTAQRR